MCSALLTLVLLVLAAANLGYHMPWWLRGVLIGHPSLFEGYLLPIPWSCAAGIALFPFNNLHIALGNPATLSSCWLRWPLNNIPTWNWLHDDSFADCPFCGYGNAKCDHLFSSRLLILAQILSYCSLCCFDVSQAIGPLPASDTTAECVLSEPLVSLVS